MIKVVLQKNVNIHMDGRGSFSRTHKDFHQWLKSNKVQSFYFRPSDMTDDCSALAKRRISKIESLGFIVLDSGQPHYYKKAVYAPEGKLHAVYDEEANEITEKDLSLFEAECLLTRMQFLGGDCYLVDNDFQV